MFSLHQGLCNPGLIFFDDPELATHVQSQLFFAGHEWLRRFLPRGQGHQRIREEALPG